VTGEEFVDRPIQDIGPMLPDSCLVALVTRDGETRVPGADFVVEESDRLTLLGQRDAVSEGMDLCEQ
jgi:Trk K+ transport system NAD-binding subunit